MMRAGTTTACDVTVPFDGWLETMAQSGMRFYAAPTFASARWGMSAPQTVTWKWDEARGLAEFETAKRVMDDAEAHNSGRLDAMVFPGADRHRDARAVRAPAASMPTSRAGRFSTHIGQSVVEVREMIRRHNMTPIQWAAHNGLLTRDTVLAHCILLDDHPQIRWHTRKDLDLIAESGASVAHCPQPFARYGLAMDHVGRYRARGVNVGLGTDCAPHNLIEEMRLAIVAGRLMSEDISSLDTAGAFEAATFGGAAALGRDDIGAPGAGHGGRHRAGRSRHPLMQPARDPLRSFVFHAADRAVRTVLVDGEIVLADGEPVHLDPKAAMETLAEAQARMIRDAPKIDYAQRPGDQISPLSLGMSSGDSNVPPLAKPGRWRVTRVVQGHGPAAIGAVHDPSVAVMTGDPRSPRLRAGTGIVRSLDLSEQHQDHDDDQDHADDAHAAVAIAVAVAAEPAAEAAEQEDDEDDDDNQADGHGVFL